MGLLFRDVRPYQGRSISSDTGAQSIALGTTHTFLDITGHGALKFAGFFISAANDSHKMWPRIKIDGVYVEPNGQLQGLSQRGYDSNTQPLAVTLMNVDGLCNSIYTWVPELTFDKSLLIEAANWSAANAVSCSANWLYYLL